MTVRSSGAVPPGLGGAAPDRTLTELLEQAAQTDPRARMAVGPVEDPYRAVQRSLLAPAAPGPVRLGWVVHAMPHLHSYRVKAADGGSHVIACRLAETGLSPLGVRDTSPLPPGSCVVLWQPPGLAFAVILGVLPPLAGPGDGPVSGWLAQGCGTGRLREGVDRRPVDAMPRAGGFLDFSAGRPVDATPYEWGRVADTGLALLLSSYGAHLAVDETCGLFLSYFDRHLRLAGRNLLVESAAHAEEALCDEGETRVYRGEAAYACEALGLYAPGPGAAALGADLDVLYRTHRAKLDLAEGLERLDPFHRYREYGGYLGQGRQRQVVLPPAAEGPRLMGDGAVDVGVFHDHVALDGSYALRSAKSVFIGKRPALAVPRKRREADDLSAGADDAARDNYRFAGTHGGGPEHRVGDVAVEGEAAPLRRAAAAADLAAYAHDWKALHPFRYHAGDFDTPPEGESPLAGEELLDFDALRDADRLPDPEPVTARVDDRYGEVAYYRRGCGAYFLEDGTLVVEGPCGERLMMADGNIELSAPGDVRVFAGKRVVLMSGETVVRSRGSIDVSSAAGDVRVKAERNLQILAGNSGSGGVLIESKAAAPGHAYADRFGEDVVSSGVVLRAPRSEVAALGGDVYLRTGGGDAAAGAITLDADQGRAPLVLNARAVEAFAPGGVFVFHTEGGEASGVRAAHYFGPDAAVVGSPLLVGGALSLAGGLTADGSVAVTGSVVAGGAVAGGSGGLVAPVDPAFASDLRRQTSDQAGQAAALASSGSEAYGRGVVDRYYAPEGAIGSDAVLAAVGFSFRDPPGEPVQYRTANLRLPEPRWAQLVRLGAATGGRPWEEPAVACQGVDTYPWPGRKKWAEDPSVLRLRALKLVDPATGAALADPGPFEAASLDAWEPATMRDSWRTVI